MTVPKSISEDSNLLSPTQVAKELGVHRSTVHVWIQNKMVKTEKHGAFHGVPRSEVERLRKIYDLPPPKKRKKKGKAKS